MYLIMVIEYAIFIRYYLSEIIFYSPWNARNVLLTNHDIKLFVKEPN